MLRRVFAVSWMHSLDGRPIRALIILLSHRAMPFELERLRWMRRWKIRGFLSRSRRNEGVRPFPRAYIQGGEHVFQNSRYLSLTSPSCPISPQFCYRKTTMSNAVTPRPVKRSSPNEFMGSSLSGDRARSSRYVTKSVDDGLVPPGLWEQDCYRFRAVYQETRTFLGYCVLSQPARLSLKRILNTFSSDLVCQEASERPSSRAPVDFPLFLFLFVITSCSTTTVLQGCDTRRRIHTRPDYIPSRCHCLSFYISLFFFLSSRTVEQMLTDTMLLPRGYYALIISCFYPFLYALTDFLFNSHHQHTDVSPAAI